MKCFQATILSAVLALGALFPSFVAAGVSFAAAEEVAGEDKLLLPSSYEQYLPLNHPADISVTENHIAIADGNTVYLYDRRKNEYRLFEHTANQEEAQNRITKLQFSDNDTLYFADESLWLYTLSPDEEVLESTRSNLALNTFSIYGDTVYYTSNSQISKTKLWELDSTKGTTLVSNISSKPALTLDGETLYYTEGGKILCKEGDSEFSRKLSDNETVVSLAVGGGKLFYTTDVSKRLFVENLATGEKIASYESGYSALSVYDGYVYAVKDGTVRRYDPAADKFTSYEIGADSSSPTRLSGATDVTLGEGNLLFCDAGNSRISVLDRESGEFEIFPLDFTPLYAASDGKTLLAAGADQIVLYNLLDGSEEASYTSFGGTVKGAVCVYGTYYFLTENAFYRLDEDALAAAEKPNGRLLASDFYGNLYVLFADNGVYRFKESEFTDANCLGEKVCSVAPSTTKIAVDYEQTVYSLSGNTLYSHGGEMNSYPLAKSAVYSQTPETTVSSFAFGMETGDIYILYAGNFLIDTTKIPLPTLRTIPVNGADQKIFDNRPAEFSIVEIEEKSMLIHFDLETLEGATYFPYLGHSREQTARTALKLEETETYCLVAVFDEKEKSYSAAILLKNACTPLPTSEYLKPAEGFEGGGYTTNALKLYKFPYLTKLLTVADLKKNQPVKVLGEITAPDYSYYQVEYQTETGEKKTGYVPKSYIVDFDGVPPVNSDKSYGEQESDNDSVWRLVFLSLGLVIICILTDCLILREPKKD